MRGDKFLRPGKNLYGQKTDVEDKILKARVVFKNRRSWNSEQKVYYMTSVTQQGVDRAV